MYSYALLIQMQTWPVETKWKLNNFSYWYVHELQCTIAVLIRIWTSITLFSRNNSLELVDTFKTKLVKSSVKKVEGQFNTVVQVHFMI